MKDAGDYMATRTTLGRQKNNQKRRGALGEPTTVTTHSADEASSSDEFEEPGYVCPNDLETKNQGKRSPQRRRRASTGTLPFETQDDYADPWDCYSPDWGAQTYDKYLEPYDAIQDSFSTKIKNEVSWQMSPLMPRTPKEEEEGIYDVIGEPAAAAAAAATVPAPGDEDYIYDVILANPTDNQGKDSEDNGKALTLPPTTPTQPAPFNANMAAPQLPPRRMPLKPPRSPDVPIPGPRIMRVESEPAHLFTYDTSPQKGETASSGQYVKAGSAPQRQVPSKPPRKVVTKQDSSSKPPKLPPRKGETVESAAEPEECPIYEPVNVNVKDMIAILQEKAVTMPQLVNPLLSSGKASPQ